MNLRNRISDKIGGFLLSVWQFLKIAVLLK